MKYKNAGRIALANINKNTLINELKLITIEMEEYKHLIPTPSSKAFINDMGRQFREDEFISSTEFIGSGFFADVYRVQHLTTSIMMAFKVPKATESINRFMNEIQLLKRLSHINILRFHGICVIDGFFGCLTEYLDSGSLSGLIERYGANLEWPTVVRIAGDISKGLAYLHQQLILHRDLSSENILLDKKIEKNNSHNCAAVKYRAVIADFGLFLDLKRKRSDSLSTVGNPFYTAPENLRNESPYSFTSDVFSFGMILCEIITGLKNDPSTIPRTDNYGLNYKELKVRKDCPKWLQALACDCCMMHVANRPSMRRASEIIAENKKYIKLWHNVQVFEEESIDLSNSLNVTKLRTMSVSMRRPFCRDKLKSIHNTNSHRHNPLPYIVPRTLERPLCRYNSVDSFMDPRLVSLDKASKDPGYIDIPLTTSMLKLDPRRNNSRKLYRCSSDSNLSHRINSKKHSPVSDRFVFDDLSSEVFERVCNSSQLFVSYNGIVANNV